MKLILDHITYSVAGHNFNYNGVIDAPITAIFGYSGSGKTTLMRLIAGLQKPTGGKMVFNDQVLFDSEQKIDIPPEKRRLGIVFQEHYLFPHLTVKQNLNYSQKYLKKIKALITFDAVVTLLDIKKLLNKRPNELSGGERQRVAIGRALLTQPELLLMDEPFSNLDRHRRKEISTYLLKISRRFKIPMLLISHDLGDILRLTRYFLVVDWGEIKGIGDYQQIARREALKALIPFHHYLNIITVKQIKYDQDEKLHHFKLKSDTVLRVGSGILKGVDVTQKEVSFGISPDDIVLTTHTTTGISVRNQLKGEITDLLYQNGTCFVTVNCGVILIAEITASAATGMGLMIGETTYCLIKAKAIELVEVR